jgi:hypothetical protein
MTCFTVPESGMMIYSNSPYGAQNMFLPKVTLLEQRAAPPRDSNLDATASTLRPARPIGAFVAYG